MSEPRGADLNELPIPSEAISETNSSAGSSSPWPWIEFPASKPLYIDTDFAEMDPDEALDGVIGVAVNMGGTNVDRVNFLQKNEGVLLEGLKRNEISFYRILDVLGRLGEEVDFATREKAPDVESIRKYKAEFLIRNLGTIQERLDSSYSYLYETIDSLSIYMTKDYRQHTAPMADFFINQFQRGRINTDFHKRKFFSFVFDVGDLGQRSGAMDEIDFELNTPFNSNPDENRAKVFGYMAGAFAQGVPDEIRERARDLYAKELSKYGLIEEQDMITCWGESCPEGMKEFIFGENMRAIYTLESLRPGIASSLRTEFGIADFSRYPIDLLVWQFDNKDNPDIPYGILINPQADHNGAFYQDKFFLNTVFSELQGLGYGLRVYEAGKVRDIPRLFVRADERYGLKNKISFAIIGGHGEKNSIQLGIGIGGDINLEYQLGRANTKIGRHLSSLKNYFIKNPSIILHSCSTGIDAGIGHEISALGGRVIAPDEDTYDIKVHVKKDKEGNLEFIAEYEGLRRRALKSKQFDRGSKVKPFPEILPEESAV